MQKEADYQHESVTDVSGSFVTDVPVQTTFHGFMENRGQATFLDRLIHVLSGFGSDFAAAGLRRSCWLALAALRIERWPAIQLMLTVVRLRMTWAMAIFLGSLP